MKTDGEKLAMLDRAYALDMGRKVALEVAKHLTTLEIRDLGIEQEQTVRDKLSSARKAWRESAQLIVHILDEPVNHGRSASGPLFDENLSVTVGVAS